MESMYGETYSPHHSKSSPVLTMMISSSAGTTWHSPSTNFAPPVPPVSTVIMRPSAHTLCYPLRFLPVRLRLRHAPLPAARTPDTPATAAPDGILSPRSAPVIAPDAATAFPD